MRAKGTVGRRMVIGAALTALAAAAGAGVPAMAASAAPGTAGNAASAAPAARMLGAGQVGSRSEVPWHSVGSGWALAMYSASSGGEGVPFKVGAYTLYLADPAGGRYVLASWPASKAPVDWNLQAWSGDSRRALLTSGNQVRQLTLATGKVTSFKLPANYQALGYTRPDGLNVLVEQGFVADLHSRVSLARYSLTGKLQRKLASVEDLGQVAYQPAGAELAAGDINGLELIGNDGGVIRSLPVPGVKYGCNAVRWWSASTILASCQTPSGASSRLWLVPASGARPTAMTPASRHNYFDLGDFNAWQLNSGLYLDAYGGCGTVNITRQPAHGPETLVNVPDSDSSLVETATSTRLMVLRMGPCMSRNSLVWLNPATGALKVAVPEQGNQSGVIGVVPYFVTGKR
jgi:hypothetical protein